MAEPPPHAGDLDLRLVRYFTVLAKHEHFGRAATELHVTQPSLSRQIRQLEDRLGARLLHRDALGSRLTEAGKAFLPQAQALLRSSIEAAASARAVAEPGRIAVGYVSNLFVTDAVRELRRRRPEAEVDTLYLQWLEPRRALLEHRVDVVLARPPFPADQLRVIVLYEEPRVLLVPADHRLAGRESITVADIADEPLPRLPDAACNAFWRVDPRPDGSPAPGGPSVESVEGNPEIIAGGRAVAIVPAAVATGAIRPDLTTVPIRDIGPGHVVVATRCAERNPLVDVFVECARSHFGPPPGEGGARSTPAAW